MAQRLIELSCKRFSSEISNEDDELIRATSLDDVRVAIAQIETQLASRGSLRYLSRLNPYLDAVERYSKAVDPLCNGVPFLPYIWAPVKFIIVAVHEHTQTLDKMLSAYAEIGNSLPWLSRLGNTFAQDQDFQRLFAFLYEDIIEFHRKAYALTRKPAWKIFFCSAWGRFEQRFGDLIESITKIGALIDREAASLDIQNASEWRRKSLEDATVQERRWQSTQAQTMMKWLETGDNDQELKLDWLKGRCCPGTGSWITSNEKFRSWLQRGRGNPIMWLYGKPGSGKSVLVSQIISFLSLKKGTRVLFYFCDYHSTPYEITARVFRAFAAQVMRIAPETIPYFDDEYRSKGQRPSVSVLRGALAKVLAEFDDVRLLVDGIDELPACEHKALINELKQLVKLSGSSCKLMISSQDVPSIRPLLSQKLPQKNILFLGDEMHTMEKDVGTIVKCSLEDLDENIGITIGPPLLEELRRKIVQKSEGMLLWVHLVLSLLETSANLAELRSNVDSLPKDLEAVYERILNNIRDRCSPSNLARVRRIFGWLIFSQEQSGIMKYEVLIGTSLHEGSDCLSRDNRPFPTALEICKPLIEDGPGGTVAIIHSTVAQYLLSRPSGPLISSSVAHRDIAFACISQLIQVLDYAHRDKSSPELMIRTGLGLLGLQSYANEYWIEHFLQGLEDQSSAITETSVCYDTISPINSPQDPDISSNLPLDKLDPVPGIQRLIRQVHNFRKTLEDQQSKHGLNVNALELDCTLFSRADANYQWGVQHLSQLDSYHELSRQELLVFRSDYGRTAFTCSIRSCQYYRFGFDSAEKLDEHKRVSHGKAFKCYAKGCLYNDVGFASSRSLREHQRKRHSHPKLLPVPDSIGRLIQSDHKHPRQQSTRDGDHSPTSTSPSKRQRVNEFYYIPGPDDVTIRNGHHVQSNNNETLPGDSSIDAARQMLIANGINPDSIHPMQLQNFANAPPASQQKSIATYSSNLGPG
ncbi:nacht domain-containing protein [Fusarium flagelliforme]|uniref:Nacht domain-containing protein n=1 Tax=Fusarium flagelliforme TaxID=2675880 RepID=A0A395MGB5_9HYPO|nr:nacht domain-containing protein [Fusarium flagelliforme]